MGCGVKKTAADLAGIYTILFKSFGPQYWWPARTKWEVIIGAILTQNTSWLNVEKAIKNLRRARCLNGRTIGGIKTQSLYPLLKPTGYYRLKAKRLKAMVNFINRRYQGNLNHFFKNPLDKAREELLSVSGVGPETADSILLYAGNKPIFVVDAYTRRIFGRLGLIKTEDTYEKIQRLFMSHLPCRLKLFNEYHALIVRLGKNICQSKPQCGLCPLSYQRIWLIWN